METLCGLFGKSKQAYYKHKHKSFSELEIEREVLSIVETYRSEMPVIGGLKLYYLTRSVLGDALDMGRDKFLNLLHRHKLIIPPRKSHHTTNSNHIYFKYPNLAKELVITYVNQLWVCDITYIYTYDAAGSVIGMQYREADYAAEEWDIYLYEKNLLGDIVAVYNEAGVKLVTYGCILRRNKRICIIKVARFKQLEISRT